MGAGRPDAEVAPLERVMSSPPGPSEVGPVGPLGGGVGGRIPLDSVPKMGGLGGSVGGTPGSCWVESGPDGVDGVVGTEGGARSCGVSMVGVVADGGVVGVTVVEPVGGGMVVGVVGGSISAKVELTADEAADRPGDIVSAPEE